jgi:hypothetical protein
MPTCGPIVYHRLWGSRAASGSVPDPIALDCPWVMLSATPLAGGRVSDPAPPPNSAPVWCSLTWLTALVALYLPHYHRIDSVQ